MEDAKRGKEICLRNGKKVFLYGVPLERLPLIIKGLSINDDPWDFEVEPSNGGIPFNVRWKDIDLEKTQALHPEIAMPTI